MNWRSYAIVLLGLTAYFLILVHIWALLAEAMVR